MQSVGGARGDHPGEYAVGPALDSGQFLQKLSSVPLVYQPGAVWDYGFGLDVLGLIIESIAEEPLGRYLQDRVWKPLGMTDTSFQAPIDKIVRSAKALPNDPVTGLPQPSAAINWAFDCGRGGAASTASDYLRFALASLAPGALNTAYSRQIRRKIESTVRYLGIEVDDAFAISEQIDV